MRLWKKKQPKEPRIHAAVNEIEVIVRVADDYTAEQYFNQLTTGGQTDWWWITGDSIFHHGPKGVRFRTTQGAFWLETS